MRKHMIIPFLFLALCCRARALAQTRSAAAPAAPPQLTLVKAGRLLDTRGGRVLENQGIRIEGERIKLLNYAAQIRLEDETPPDSNASDRLFGSFVSRLI